MGQLNANTQANFRSKRLIVLIAGDFLVLLLFMWIGRTSHRFSDTGFSATLATVAPFIISWYLTTPWFGLFRAEISQKTQKLVPRLLLAWIVVGAPLALILRTLYLGRSIPGGIVPIFAVIMLTGTTLSILAWRLGYIWWVNRQPS